METRFYALATFNAEVGRGLVHTPEYVKIMKQLQKEYDKLYHKGPKVLIYPASESQKMT